MVKVEEYENWDKADCEVPEEERFKLTEWGCLAATLNDYGLDVSNIPARVGEHMVADFLNLMVTCGYIGVADNTKKD